MNRRRSFRRIACALAGVAAALAAPSVSVAQATPAPIPQWGYYPAGYFSQVINRWTYSDCRDAVLGSAVVTNGICISGLITLGLRSGFTDV